MNLQHIKHFIVVAEEKSVRRAAVRLNITQPPLTRHIQQLEKNLGTTLFIRTQRGMELNEAGELFLQEAHNICSIIEQATERTLRAGQGHIGRIDIAIFGSGILKDIPKIILAFRKSYPEVKVVLHTMGKGKQIEALHQRRIDIGFNRLLAPQPQLKTEFISSEPLLIAVNENHELAQHKTIPFSILADNPLILFPTGTRPNFIDKVTGLCHEMGIVPNIAQEVGDVVHGIALVASGFGVCLVPDSATALTLPGVVYRPLTGLPEGSNLDLSCLYRSDDKSLILQSFLEICRSYSKANMNA